LFQAEDGIRDFHVTGVQTCALPILSDARESGCLAPGFNTSQEEEARNEFQSGNAVFQRNWPYVYSLLLEDGGEVSENFDIAPLRSEERREGEEWQGEGGGESSHDER